MYFAENVLGRLFPPYAAGKRFAVVSEMRKRNHWQRMAYLKWLLSGRYKVINQSVITTYNLEQPWAAWFTDLRFSNTDSACGITLVFGKHVSANETEYYFEYLKNRLVNLGYQIQHSYREMSDQSLHVETRSKYFLKNSPKQLRKGRSEVNKNIVTLEYICIDHAPSHCKILWMASGNKKNNPTADMERLMGTLFEF